MKYFDSDEAADLQAAFDELVADWPDVEATTMFGCPSYRTAETLFAVLVTDGVVLTRLPTDRRAELADSFETGPFEAGGRTVSKWVRVAVPETTALVELRPYVEASYEAARGDSAA